MSRPPTMRRPGAMRCCGTTTSVSRIQSPLRRYMLSLNAPPSVSMPVIVSVRAASVAGGKAWLPRKWSGWWWVFSVSTTGSGVMRAIAARNCSP